MMNLPAQLKKVAVIAAYVLALPISSLLADPASDGAFWKDKIEKAQANSTVALPAGKLEMAYVELPAGVKINGVAYQLLMEL